MIALAVLVAYVALANLYVEAAVVLGVAFIFVTPWIMVRSLRFTAINSAYRNIRFDFQGKYGEAFMVAFVWPILNLLCLTLLTPLVLKNPCLRRQRQPLRNRAIRADGLYQGVLPALRQGAADDCWIRRRRLPRRPS